MLHYRRVVPPDLRPIIGKEIGSKEKKMVYSKGGNKSTKVVDNLPNEKRSYVLTDDEILLLAEWGKMIEDH